MKYYESAYEIDYVHGKFRIISPYGKVIYRSESLTECIKMVQQMPEPNEE